MTDHTLFRRCATVALGLLVAIGACTTSEAPSSQQTNPPPPPLLSKAQADSLGQVVAVDADAMIEGTGFDATAVLPFSPAGAASLSSPSSGPWCMPTKSPDPVTNSDGDPVPDSVRIDFTGCTFGTRHGTVTLGGTIDFIDPTPTTTDRAIKTVYTGFAQTTTDAQGDTIWAFTEDGSREAIGTSSALQFTEANFLTTWRWRDRSAQHLKNWSAMFTADTAGTITSRRLPSGTWDLSGTSTYIRSAADTDTLSFTVATNPGLHYNRSCMDWPRFDSGTLTAVVTKNGATATVTIAFTACGQFTVTKS
ncbi:MAG TPA: hypothetical protein VMH88_14390 [Gemmatimonadales bacterium]|nr:hypothetical protein [Gemmatimonadales bacterium]